jgi:alpha-tubulin suppressor-like RCC1 family protein
MKIYSGNFHSMAISKDVFEVYTWGDGSKGQLGRRGEMSAEPDIVEELTGKDIIKGSCGYDFTACLTGEGKIYMFGSNVNLKLGVDSINSQENFPKSVDGLIGIKKVILE